MEKPLHTNELSVDLSLVERLIGTQFPQYAHLRLRPLGATGSSNKLFRLGNDYLVRLPRQPGGGAAIHKESRWVPMLSVHLPVDVPEILAIGHPDFGYTEDWSIVSWLDGDLARAHTHPDAAASDQLQLAIDLADFILALQSVEIPAAAHHEPTLRWYRGQSLAHFDAQMRRNIEKCRAIDDLDLDLDAALTLWEDAMKASDAHTVEADRWFHSDLVAENLLVSDGHLTGVLDFGGLAIGDPTIDLHGAWEVFDVPARDVFRTRLGVTDAAWIRGRAWALAIALSTFAYYWNTMPWRIRDRLVMARSVLADAGR